MCNIIVNCCVSCRRLVGIKIRTCSTAPPGCMCLSDDGVRQLPTIMSNIIITTTDGVIVADLTKMFSMLKVFNKHPDYAHSCRPSDLLGNADGRHDDVDDRHRADDCTNTNTDNYDGRVDDDDEMVIML